MNDFRNDVLFFCSIWGYIDVSDFLYGNNKRTVITSDILRTMFPFVLISTMLFLQRLYSRSEKRTTQRKHNLANKTAAMVLAFLLSNSIKGHIGSYRYYTFSADAIQFEFALFRKNDDFFKDSGDICYEEL